MGFFDKLKAGLKKTKHALFGPLDRLFSSYDKIDDDFYEELSDVLIMSDVGVETAEEICGLLRARVKEKKLRGTSEARAELQEIMSGLIGDGGELNLSSAPAVVLVIGVNGVGKTTSIGKIALAFEKQRPPRDARRRRHLPRRRHRAACRLGRPRAGAARPSERGRRPRRRRL